MNDQVAPPGEGSDHQPIPIPTPSQTGPGDDAGAGRDGRPSYVAQPYLHELVTGVRAPAMSLSGQDGQVRPGGAQGVYVADIRALSRLVLTVNGREPVAIGRDTASGASNRFYSVVPTDQDGSGPTLSVTRERDLKANGVLESFTITFFGQGTVRCRAELHLACDLAGTGTVKSGRGGEPKTARPSPAGLTWPGRGPSSVTALGAPPPAAIDPAGATLGWDLTVAAGSPATFSVLVEMHEEASAGAGPVVAAPSPGVALTAPRVVADDRRLARFVEASTQDLQMLQMGLPDHRDEVFLAAGAPWFLTLFGRDSIWAARMLLPLGTALALGTLRALARFQGQRTDPLTGEHPGKILHELRRGDPAGGHVAGHSEAQGGGTSGSGHDLPPVYYGTIDATPLWVCLLHDAWRWGAPPDEVEALLGPMQAALGWVRDFGCAELGFLSYVDELGHGLANQGWKDSSDGVQSRDGRLAQPPVALCEVQGYAYEAAMGGGALLDHFGLPGGDRWRAFAAELAQRFRAHYWVEDEYGPYPAIALNGDGSPVNAVTSNMGHLLSTGILNAEEAELVSRRLLAPELNSGFGLRTLATSSAGYNPLSYHCGSVWGHDTAIAITGLAQSEAPSARQAAASLIEGVVTAAEAFDYRLPELFAGHQRGDGDLPLPYPAACRPQAWTAAGSVAVLSALIGLRPDVPGGDVAINPIDSALGLWRVQGLAVGGQELTIELEGNGKAKVDGVPAGLRLRVGA